MNSDQHAECHTLWREQREALIDTGHDVGQLALAHDMFFAGWEASSLTPQPKLGEDILEEFLFQALKLRYGEKDRSVAKFVAEYITTAGYPTDQPKLSLAQKLIDSFNAAKEEIRWYRHKAAGDLENGRIVGAENILAEFRDVTRMAEGLFPPAPEEDL